VTYSEWSRRSGGGRRAAFVVFLLLLAWSAAGCTGDAPSGVAPSGAKSGPPVVRVDGGRIEGVRAARTWAFLGVPYAAPPVGDLRWRPPQAPRPWRGVRVCDHTAPICPQIAGSGILGDRQKQSEDCLYLNVWTPARTFRERLPVMVWIHGGSFLSGSGSSPLYDGAQLAAHGVVVVTINYRLGPFGFFAHPLLTAESPHHSSGNYGLLDQRAALLWVRHNVAKLGGDPLSVTVFGESAGAASIIDHLVSPLGDALFDKAIVESAPYVDDGIAIYSTRPLETAERLGQRLSRRLGCAGKADELAALRAVPTDRLLAVGDPSQQLFPKGITYQPVVDRWILPDEPVDLLTAGEFHKVPLLIGSNRDEADIARPAVARSGRPLAALRRELRDVYVRQAGRARAASILRVFPPSASGGTLAATLDTVTLTVFTAPARHAADRMAAAGVATYRYLFSGAPLGGRLGAFHGAELPYVFGNPLVASGYGLGGGLSETMMRYWTNFAAHGVPSGGDASGGDLATWPAWSVKGQDTLDLGSRVRVLKGYQDRACDIVERLCTPAGE
jgi:para-nitrobenzyl esterase